MGRLTSCEAQALLDSLSALYADSHRPGIEVRFSAAVRRAIPSEIISFDSFDPGAREWSNFWYDPPGSVSSEIAVSFGHYFHEHPLLAEFLRTGLSSPRKVTDFITPRQFHRLGLYNEVYRRVGTDAQLSVGLTVSPNRILLVTPNRTGADFTESDRRLLAALRPHLLAAYRNAEALARALRQQAQMRVAVEESGVGLIILGMDGRVRLMTEQARAWLSKYFDEPLRGAARLPERLRPWYEHHLRNFTRREPAPPVRPLEVVADTARLHICLAINSAAEQITLLLDEESNAFPPERLESLGLTRREAEVLGWVTLGKTNCEIGELCVISARTVQKHLENVFQKLGVETRTAAARRAMEVWHGRIL
jgi:DNA-binding CsgD family transcriptional regulator